VGKLEPFRQEEARKVHADAFIIKPFEATELLAALSKLEAKNGSRSEPKSADQAKTSGEAKSSKHVPPTMARYEREVADGVPRFGDHESGWKARLPMPSPGTKPEEPQQEPEISTQANQHFERDASAAPAFAVKPDPAGLEAANSLQGLPSDVTPDELAAIAAAAAAIGSSNGNQNINAGRQQAHNATGLVAERSEHATFASEPRPADLDLPRSAASTSGGPVASQVDAVFTSFAGSSGGAAPETKFASHSADPATVTGISGSDAASLAVGARWVAEEIPVQPAESSLLLEREMHKAFAAFAAAEHSASYEPGPVDKRDEPMFAAAAPPAIGAPTPFTDSAPGIEQEDVSPRLATPEPPVPMSSRISESDLSKPPAAPFAPVTPDEPSHAVVAFGDPHPFDAVVNVAALANAPSAESQPQTPGPVRAEQAEISVGADQWHDLRQPVVSTPATNGNGTVAFEDLTADQSATTNVIETQLESAAMAAAASGDSSATTPADASLSSIVDNMLAELKPRLMAELAKKMEKK
jgi:hypothetical protein